MDKSEHILYDRVTAGRDARYAVRTCIVEKDGSRIVKKMPATPEAAAHVRAIEKAGRALEEYYAPRGIGVNRCTLQEGSDGTPVLVLEYLEGRTCEAALDATLLGEGGEAAAQQMAVFLERVLPEADAPVTDLDLLPANVLETEAGWVLLDYEWTVFEPVPVDFVKYRILHYYRESHTMRQKLLPQDWYTRFGLSEEDCQAFAVREEAFQNRIRPKSAADKTDAAGASGPVAEANGPGDSPAVPENVIREDVASAGSWSGTEILQIYLSETEGFTEEAPLFLPFTGGRIETKIKLRPEIRAIRLDPGDMPCICHVEELRTEKKDLLPYIETPGIRTDADRILFSEADPWFRIVPPYHAGETLYIKLAIEHASRAGLEEAAASFEHENETKNNLKETAGADTGKTAAKSGADTARKTHVLPGLESAAEAGFAGRLRRKLHDKKPGKKLLYHIDRGNQTEDCTILRGWAFDPDGDVQVLVCDRSGKELAADIRRIRRADVEEAMGTVQAAFCGFYICLQNDDLPKDGIVLLFEGPVRRRAYVLIPGEDVVFSEEVAKDQPADWIDYMEWFLAQRVTEEELEQQRQTVFPQMPRISIVVPLYNTPLSYLRALLESVAGQSYTNWELCLADGSNGTEVEEEIQKNWSVDPRINYRHLEENTGISGNTNAAIEQATGEFIMLTDHDDLLEKDALFEIVRAINSPAAPDILYTDEDLMDETGNQFYSPRFKCDFNLDLLRSINYICHIFVVRRSVLEAAGRFNPALDGAQDWDLILRCCEQSDRVAHIPKVLYHWRASEASTAGNPDSKTYAIRAAEQAVTEHLERCGLPATLEYSGIFILFRPLLAVSGEPKVSILIPNKDQVSTLKTCVDSILSKSTYGNYEIVIIENNSVEKETFACYKEYEEAHANIRVVRYEGPFNYSTVNNFGAAHATGEYLLLLNNDTEVITPDWIERMLGYCQRDDVGIVGAKLYYEDHTVQHCGVVVGMGGFAGHVHTKEPATEAGHLGRLQAVMDVSAVTAACLMVKRSVFDAAGGLDEGFRVALNDIDFCLRVREKGYLVVCHAGVELFHYESKSRGYEETPEKHARFKEEIRRFRTRWSGILEEGDPYYSPHVSLVYGDSRIRAKDESFAIVEEIAYEDRLAQAKET